VTSYVGDVSVDQEIQTLRMQRPHVVLLGAGASKAAVPNGDRNGRPVPLLRELAVELDLARRFPDDLRNLALTDFEAAYSRLVDRADPLVDSLNNLIGDYFRQLRLPDEPNLYDYVNLCLRAKDVIFTFNWDPLIIDSQLRLRRSGVELLPRVFALHGNVAIGYCTRCEQSGLGMIGHTCGGCGEPYMASNLLFPVERKDYTADSFINREWRAMEYFLGECFMFTIFGYSAPVTDVEAVASLKAAWGTVDQRNMEQTEIIDRPGCDVDELREKWDPFIHTHHYDVFDSCFESWMANHPRRTGEAYMSQYWDAQFMSNHPVPLRTKTLADLVDWFQPLLEVERERRDTLEVGAPD
jgi:NAD-dependent SIR2 family protein deacetylase